MLPDAQHRQLYGRRARGEQLHPLWRRLRLCRTTKLRSPVSDVLPGGTDVCRRQLPTQSDGSAHEITDSHTNHGTHHSPNEITYRFANHGPDCGPHKIPHCSPKRSTHDKGTDCGAHHSTHDRADEIAHSGADRGANDKSTHCGADDRTNQSPDQGTDSGTHATHRGANRSTNNGWRV